MKTIEIIIAEIAVITAVASAARKAVGESYRPAFEKLSSEGAHRNELSELGSQCDSAQYAVDAAAREMLESYELTQLLPHDLATVVPVDAENLRLALVQPKGAEFAFLLHRTCEYVTTSHKLRLVNGMAFGFLCGCSNCNRPCRKDETFDPEKIVATVAAVAKEKGIKKIVMRHSSSWSDAPARKVGVHMREIEDSIFGEEKHKLEKQFAARYGHERA